MALPRRFWVLVGWVIALSTLATAFDVVESTYADQSALAGCTKPAAAPDYPACSNLAYMEGAARVAGVIVQMPAVGLALVAAAMAIGSRLRVVSTASVEAKPVQGEKPAASPKARKVAKPADTSAT